LRIGIYTILFTSANNAKNTVKTPLLKHSEVIFSLNNFFNNRFEEKNEGPAMDNVKVLHCGIRNPQNVMTNRRKLPSGTGLGSEVNYCAGNKV